MKLDLGDAVLIGEASAISHMILVPLIVVLDLSLFLQVHMKAPLFVALENIHET